MTAVEIMPVAQFPGARNWGYDGAYPFAVQESYGGPAGLKRFVDACHERGLAVVLDVVYNHLGPEGNYFRDFGPYFTDQYRTPWGDALNFDGPGSDQVRDYFLQNALYWQTEFHVDALRLDAVHAIKDFSAYPFLAELADYCRERARQLGRPFYLIAESDLNDSRLVRPRSEGGFELDSMWSDDFHHAIHTLLTGEIEGYYEDFGGLEELASAFEHGFFVQRAVFAAPRTPARQRPEGACAEPLRGVFAESRPGGQSRPWRATDGLDRLRGPEAGRRSGAAFALYPPAVHGRGVWRVSAFLVLREPWRSGTGGGGSRRAQG